MELGIALSPQREKRRRALDSLLLVIRVLPFDEAAARAAASVRGTLKQVGSPIGPLDTLIAGTAIAHPVLLVTHNAREFGRVRGLKMVDWF